MDGKYEFINNEGGLPIKTFIHSVNFREIHWHKHVEILYVLKGSVGVRVGKELNILKENDLILINNSELHSTKKTNEDNIILSLQIDSNYFNKYIKNFSNMYFKCKSISEINEDSLDYDLIRVHIAKILWDVNKKSVNFGLDIIKETIEIISYLMQNCVDSTLSDNRTIFSDERLVKINSIINYIDENFDNGISLEDVAKQQDNSVYYVSHFIKDALGLSFQEYIDLKRLDKAIALIINTEKTITDIALESGFPSPKSLNRIIKREYGLTSKEFKEKNKIDNAIFEKKADKEDRYIGQSYMDFTEKVDYEKLYKYLDMPNVNKKEKEYKIYKTIKCDFPNKSKEYKKHWKELLTFGRASEGLRSEWKAQLREIQREIGFKYIRFHGIFSDDMMVYNVDEKGQVTYNWSYVDDLFDFFQEVNIKPFVELDFMPNDIKSGEEYFFWWRANITPPKEISLWTDMIKEFLKHCINRYGLEEVESWKFEVWNEPELEGIFWVGGMKAYFEFYASTVNAIKAISKKFYVGGPVITNLAVMQGTWLREFLKYCKNNNTPLDYISIHIYPYNFAEPEKVAEIYEGFYGGE
ncbi:MAG: helix-turn-helix domain-containing protein, partial [Gudongella sp.]|nr:helix-turn-helix domain-containing protein [Gudongella sp.]